MKEYRCTFPGRYPVGSLGYEDLTARQGYYITAANHCEAAALAATKHDEPLVDVQYDWHVRNPIANRFLVSNGVASALLPRLVPLKSV